MVSSKYSEIHEIRKYHKRNKKVDRRPSQLDSYCPILMKAYLEEKDDIEIYINTNDGNNNITFELTHKGIKYIEVFKFKIEENKTYNVLFYSFGSKKLVNFLKNIFNLKLGKLSSQQGMSSSESKNNLPFC